MDLQQYSPVTLCLSKVTLAAGTTTTISTTGTTIYLILSKFYSKAAVTNGATPTTDWATGLAFNPVPANNGSIYAVGFDSTGAVRVVQGTVTPLDINGAFITAPQLGGFGPAGSGTTDNDFCMIGYIVIKAGSTASSAPGWLFGTNNLSSVTGLTYIFVDACGIPGRPQIA